MRRIARLALLFMLFTAPLCLWVTPSAGSNDRRFAGTYSYEQLAGTRAGLAIAIPSKTASRPVSGQLTNNKDLANRLAQLEALCVTAKPSDGRDQRAAQFLAQFYTAEYSAIMARISAWASLQYAFFPI